MLHLKDISGRRLRRLASGRDDREALLARERHVLDITAIRALDDAILDGLGVAVVLGRRGVLPVRRVFIGVVDRHARHARVWVQEVGLSQGPVYRLRVRVRVVVGAWDLDAPLHLGVLLDQVRDIGGDVRDRLTVLIGAAETPAMAREARMAAAVEKRIVNVCSKE